MSSQDRRFDNLTFEDFRKLAQDKDLSSFEKIGFPSAFREGHENSIFSDIKSKVTNLNLLSTRVLDIGCGCGTLAELVIENSKTLNQALTFIDSEEMLNENPDLDFLVKIPGKFPEIPEISKLFETQDAIICYSVFQYILEETSFTKFIDTCLSLLAPRGQLLIGDIPNQSMRRRFLSSESGIEHHKKYFEDDTAPEIRPFETELGKCDDSTIIAIISRARASGFHAFLLPQNEKLPFSNRREDILIVRP